MQEACLTHLPAPLICIKSSEGGGRTGEKGKHSQRLALVSSSVMSTVVFATVSLNELGTYQLLADQQPSVNCLSPPLQPCSYTIMLNFHMGAEDPNSGP